MPLKVKATCFLGYFYLFIFTYIYFLNKSTKYCFDNLLRVYFVLFYLNKGADKMEKGICSKILVLYFYVPHTEYLSLKHSDFVFNIFPLVFFTMTSLFGAGGHFIALYSESS